MSGFLAAPATNGGPVLPEAHTITTGGLGLSPNRMRGFSTTNGFGSCSPTATTLGGSGAISEMYYDEGGGSATYNLFISGAPDSGWTTLTIGVKALTRASATYAGGNWQWNTADTVGTQAFGAISSTPTATFT